MMGAADSVLTAQYLMYSYVPRTVVQYSNILCVCFLSFSLVIHSPFSIQAISGKFHSINSPIVRDIRVVKNLKTK